MIEYDFKNMTNNEIKIEIKKLENSYEKTKTEIYELVNKLKELDSSYIKAKNELNKRNKGII